MSRGLFRTIIDTVTRLIREKNSRRPLIRGKTFFEYCFDFAEILKKPETGSKSIVH